MGSSVQEAVMKEGRLPQFVPSAMPARRGSDPITVLLVDDDDHLRGFCRSLLTKNGFTVFEAQNGLEALLTSVQHQGAIDLLITDLEMPGISGVELGRVFNDIWPSVNVAKPFAPDALVEAIGSVLVR
jgi:DNA-binding NtrC family response regulator